MSVTTGNIATVRELSDALNRLLVAGQAEAPVRVVDEGLDEYEITDVATGQVADLEDDERDVEGVWLTTGKAVGY